MSRVLVTGANGFAGRVLCRALLQANSTPIAGLHSTASWSRLQTSVPGLAEHAVIGDLGANPNLHAALENVEAVVHLAARVHQMRDNAADPLLEFRRVNVDGTKALAAAAAEKGVRRFVFVSSVKVNGESTNGAAFSEEDVPNPHDPYGVSKWEAEQALRAIAGQTGIEFVIVRPPLVYGPGVRANFLRLMNLIARGIPFPAPASENRRSLVGIGNLSGFLVQCVNHPAAANETFLLSDGEDVSTRELVVRLGRALGRSARTIPLPEFPLRPLARLLRKEAALNRLFGSLAVDSSKARHKLGWTPPFTLDYGLAETARWYLQSPSQSP